VDDALDDEILACVSARTVRRTLTPGAATKLIAGGHALWGAIAYRREIAEIARAGVFGSVGDGLFRTEHSRDGRAAAFWFLTAAPLIALNGHLMVRAERNGDREGLRVAGGALIGIGLAGAAVMPLSGFQSVPPVGAWLLLRSRVRLKSDR
jgi:hypothetical protein